jgi:hypothetical protein
VMLNNWGYIVTPSLTQIVLCVLFGFNLGVVRNLSGIFGVSAGVLELIWFVKVLILCCALVSLGVRRFIRID